MEKRVNSSHTPLCVYLSPKNNYYALQQALLHLYPDQNYTKANLQKIIISQTKNIIYTKN